MVARMLNILIATWVVVAAFAFNPPTGLFVTMLLIGVLAIGTEIIGMYWQSVRFLDTILGLILLMSGFVLRPGSDLLMWNNFFCGFFIVLLSVFQTNIKRGSWMPGGELRHRTNTR